MTRSETKQPHKIDEEWMYETAGENDSRFFKIPFGGFTGWSKNKQDGFDTKISDLTYVTLSPLWIQI
jgi:hypothetical protein